MKTRLIGGLAATALLAGALACQGAASAADPSAYPQPLGFTGRHLLATDTDVFAVGISDDYSTAYVARAGGEPVILDTGAGNQVYSVDLAERADGSLYVIASTDQGYQAFFVDPTTMAVQPSDLPPGWSNVDALGTDAAGPVHVIRSADQQVILTAGGFGQTALDQYGAGAAVAATGDLGSRDWYVGGTHWNTDDAGATSSVATLWSYDEATHTEATPIVLGPAGDPDEGVLDVVADPATGTVYATSFQDQPDSPQTYGVSVIHDGVATYHPMAGLAQKVALSPDGATLYLSEMSSVFALDAAHLVDDADAADDARSTYVDAGSLGDITTDPAGHLFAAADQSVVAFSAPGAPTGLDLAVDADWPEGGDLTWTAPEVTGGPLADDLSYDVTLTDRAGGEPQTDHWYGTEKGLDLVAGHSYDITVTADNGLFRGESATLSYTPQPVMAHPSSVAVSGAAKVGSRLSVATVGSWAQGASLSYAWVVDDRTVSTASTLSVTAGMLGKRVGLAVTGRLAGFADHTEWSPLSAKVARGTLTGAKPAITGTARVGKTLSVTAGRWTTGTTLAYTWAANGTKIAGADRPTFRLTRAQAGKQVTVTVTGTKAGYTPLSKVSSPTAKVAR